MFPARNRSEGWRHAKKDGHANEQKYAEELGKNANMISEIEQCIVGKEFIGIPTISVDGAKHVKSIFGDLTTSKVDLSINWRNGERINISLKKSYSGQVWLISVARFFSAVEFYLQSQVDSDVQAGISLFIGGENISQYSKLYEDAIASDETKFPNLVKQERHQKRLLAVSIATNYPSIWQSTLNFFNQNIGLITRLSFARGLAALESDSADLVIYNRLTSGSSFFSIDSIVEKAERAITRQPIGPGPKNGGSTLQLPTGFLQMHHPTGDNQLQFHHQYQKISML